MKFFPIDGTNCACLRPPEPNPPLVHVPPSLELILKFCGILHTCLYNAMRGSVGPRRLPRAAEQARNLKKSACGVEEMWSIYVNYMVNIS
jgi:hypothetical protein